MKGVPKRAEGLAPKALGDLGLNLLAGDLMMPAAVIRESALRHNIAAMQAFADQHGALLCPHGKTSMSPELFAMQLDAGAWGLTAATAHHVRLYRRLGIGRILLANQLVGKADVEFILAELAEHPEFDFYCLADSIEAVDALAAAASAAGLERPVQLLVETGIPSGRAGVRDIESALALARRISASPSLALCGVETFEGVSQARPDARPDAAGMLDLAVAAAEAAALEGLFAEGPVMLSAGGSAFLDLCAARLPDAIGGRDVTKVIRPGCYVTHDHGIYRRIARAPRLEPALEVWGTVLSLPESGLAIVGVGKRDVSTDVDPPQPLFVHRPGEAGGPRPADGLRTLQLWDQHLSLDCSAGALAVGDMVGFGISHPCATFDRWRALFTVDEGYRVTGAVTTLF
jgi:D-serine dehydratase